METKKTQGRPTDDRMLKLQAVQSESLWNHPNPKQNMTTQSAKKTLKPHPGQSFQNDSRLSLCKLS